MMAVDLDLGPPFMAGKLRRFFPDTYVERDWKPAYDVGSDGHFFMIQHTFGSGGRFSEKNIDKTASLIEADDVDRFAPRL